MIASIRLYHAPADSLMLVAEPASESVTGAGGMGAGAGAGYIAVVGRSIPAKRGGPSCSELIKNLKCHDDSIAIIVDKIG